MTVDEVLNEVGGNAGRVGVWGEVIGRKLIGRLNINILKHKVAARPFTRKPNHQ